MYSYRSGFVSVKDGLIFTDCLQLLLHVLLLPHLKESLSLIACPSAGHLLAMYRSTRMRKYTCIIRGRCLDCECELHVS